MSRGVMLGRPVAWESVGERGRAWGRLVDDAGRSDSHDVAGSA
jgi:hypothetical protein